MSLDASSDRSDPAERADARQERVGAPPRAAAAAGSRWDVAETHYQAALRLADQMPFVSEQAKARYWYARMLVDRDAPEDRRKAKELLETASAIYQKVGMPWHITRAEALAMEVPE